MKVISFSKQKEEFLPVQIEVSLIPGLPQIHILGLPDISIKESVLKIKSGLKHQGFEFPKAKQILVNLQGGDFKKRSSGLELAMAIAILLATKQVSPLLVGKERLESVYIYGELGLNGSVLTIDEDSLLGVSLPADAILITGESKGNLRF